MKIVCCICEGNKGSVSKFEFVDADGVSSKGNVCNGCVAQHFQRPGGLFCVKHKRSYTIFIDGTSACGDCVREDVEEDSKLNSVIIFFEWKAIAGMISRFDKRAFLKLIRVATDVNLPPDKCWDCALQVYMRRYNLTREQAFQIILNDTKKYGSIVAAALPSSDKNRKYIPPRS